ncbi:MAG: 4a-hydroxytetrahydrobiopterin dehydratase, partial [Planctomycetaceae bacterium]
GAADFCSRVADLADREGHHPDIHLYYRRVVIDCSTHKVKGLSENDFILASKIDMMQEGADLE